MIEVAQGAGERRVLRAYRAARAATVHAPLGLLTAGSVGLALSSSSTVWFWTGVGLSAAGLLVGAAQGPRLTKLAASESTARRRADERSAALQTIMRTAVQTLMAQLDTDFSRARVSIYRHVDRRFFLIARVSDVQSLEQVGRGSYPDDEGVIGLAWDRGTAYARDLPEDRTAWEEECAGRYRMSRGSLPALRMQSRSTLGRRLDLPGIVPLPVGVLLIESEMARGVTAATADTIGDEESYRLVMQVLLEIARCVDEDDVRPDSDVPAVDVGSHRS